MPPRTHAHRTGDLFAGDAVGGCGDDADALNPRSCETEVEKDDTRWTLWDCFQTLPNT